MNDPGPIQDLRIRRQIALGCEIFRSYTHCVLTKKDIGTGVAFRIGGRLFVITAGHILANQPTVHLFRGEGPATEAEILNFHAHPDSHAEDVYADVGFIEIKDVPGLPACETEQLDLTTGTPRYDENTLTFIAGCPRVGYEPEGRKGEVGLAVIGCYFKVANDRVIELDYMVSGHELTPEGGTFKEADFFDSPIGFSGGGVWALMREGDNELFNPLRHVRMIGTQFVWNEKTRVLKAMRPGFSLSFFFECYPELKP